MKRLNLTAVNHYNVYPFNHGGSLGIRGLYKALSEWFDINIVTFVIHDVYPDETYISKHIKVIPIVLPEKLADMQYEMYKQYGMSDDTFVDSSPAVIRWYHQFPEIINRIKEIAKESIVVIAEHVFTWNIIKAACPDKHLWYRANNVEYDYKRTTYDAIGCPQELLQEVYDIEKKCCMEVERILAVSQLEVDRFMDLYSIPESYRHKFMDIHSGYDTDNLETVMPSVRSKVSEEYKCSGIFIASDTPNTRLAAEKCIDIAKACPDVLIVLMGTICLVYKETILPKNILLTGIATDEEKKYYLQHCDFALNPLVGGAGINVKMFEYFAFGIPVITSVYGARGIAVKDRVSCIIADSDKFVNTVKDFFTLSIIERNKLAQNALELLQNKYSWRSIGNMIAREIGNLYDIAIDENVLPLKEIELYRFKPDNPYIPQKPFFIRCAGDFGIGCWKLLKRYNLKPIAFIDEKRSGEIIDGINVISPQDFLEKQNGEEIIVANNKEWLHIVADLVQCGILRENISVSWAGRYVFSIFRQLGNVSPYNAPEKIKLRMEKYLRNELKHY